MLKKFIRLVGGEPQKRLIDEYSHIIDAVNALEPQLESLSDAELKSSTSKFKQRISQGENLDDLLVEAFAVVREASKRTIGLRHYDVQLIGGIILHKGKIAEMRTGEGKTLVATLPIYLNSLSGKGTHLITVNDYLARRDARWMAPIYSYLGLSVGVLQMAARTEFGKKAFLVDMEKESPHEDQHQLTMVPRGQAYQADIIYGTNSEFGFDYLRDNMVYRLEDKVQRGHYFAIIDEVDNVLIDEARTPLIISGPAQDESSWYNKMSQVVRQLQAEDVEVDEKTRSVVLTEVGEIHVEEILGSPLRDPDRPEDLTPEQARILGYLEQGLRAQYLFRRNKDYLVQSGKVVIVDEFTGRLMPGRRWSEGLHQAVEAKEGVKVEPESVTYATITIQNYFRMYEKLAGMTGTAVTESEEFNKIYELEAVPIPTNLEYLAERPETNLVELDGLEGRYKYKYYASKDDQTKIPLYWKRKDYPDIVYRSEEMKLRAITQEILRLHILGRPILVGTTSVELSEKLSDRLRGESLRKLAQALILRKTWLRNHQREEDGRQIEELQFLYESIDGLNLADLRNFARTEEISFSLDDPDNLDALETILDLPTLERERLSAVLKGGIPHEVLNAKKHTEESQIIAKAGSFGAVTIATNMAGRGVDIKLGGELDEELSSSVNRILKRSGFENAYEMSMEERREALQQLDVEDYGIQVDTVNSFLQYLGDMEKVRQLGGLHVIGSERHEARRIDNQLRGRAARQGDPGSSKFYLSMEDELMRLFGGGQADNLMKRLKIDDAVPLEANLVGRIVEQSQNRVEGANFDVRKHLLEYDDVLNNQRNRIYKQRDLILSKKDLSDDVREMLQTEVGGRVSRVLKNGENPWHLLAWLNDIQPTITSPAGYYPSFMYSVLLDQVFDPISGTSSGRKISVGDARKAMVKIIDQSMYFEAEHYLDTLEDQLESAHQRLNNQIEDKVETIGMFFDVLDDDEEFSQNQRISVLFNDLQSRLGIPLRLTPEQQSEFLQNRKALIADLEDQVSTTMQARAMKRLVDGLEGRLDVSLGIANDNFQVMEWDDLTDLIIKAVEEHLEGMRNRMVGSDNSPGIIVRDVDVTLNNLGDQISAQELLNVLFQAATGTRTAFDKKTHRPLQVSTQRINYVYYAAQNLDSQDEDRIAQKVLEHLEGALDATHLLWGDLEWQGISKLSMAELDEQTRKLVEKNLSEVRVDILMHLPLSNCSGQEASAISVDLGKRSLTEVYRRHIVQVLSQQWIDYLTEMESLRVSIGLEAYAQRDPLVQYKNRAYELFQQLLSNVRLGIISRLFTNQPRELMFNLTKPAMMESNQTGAIEQQATNSTELAQPEEQKTSLQKPQPSQKRQQSASKSQKRRRKRN